MKAIVVDESLNMNWIDVPDRKICADEVLIKVHAAALNRADLLQREGKYPSPEGCPPWMGLEVSGTIIDVGSVAATKSNWEIGDEVCALLGGGGYAQMVSVRYDMIMPLPQGLSLIEAAALPEAYATSYLNLVIEGHLKPGQTAFIPAGSSGLASVAIPMAKALGARVITSVLSDQIANEIVNLGADIIINSSENDVSQVLREQEELGMPVNVAMDCLSGNLLGRCLPYMAKGGYWIVISTLAGVETTVPLRSLLVKGIHLTGSMLRNRSNDVKAQIISELIMNVWPMINRGEIKPQIYKTLHISEVEEAHAILQRNENIGKVVLIVDEY